MQIDRDQKNRASKRGFGRDQTGRGFSTMVIDDEFIDRRIIVQLLRSVEFDVVVEATNGIEGILEYREKKPQIVILDMHMPKTSGLDVLQQIKAIEPGVIVVMCTSDNTAKTVQSLLDTGADEYIVKPIDRTQFLYKMEKLLIRKGLRI
ncbi:MAG TPA: response regulator [Spirochaeta sp.]|nr:response regulator [Spirochaeta sp.]